MWTEGDGVDGGGNVLNATPSSLSTPLVSFGQFPEWVVPAVVMCSLISSISQ